MHAQRSQTGERSTPRQFAQTLKKASYGKATGYACLENAAAVSTLPQLRLRDRFILTTMRILGAGSNNGQAAQGTGGKTASIYMTLCTLLGHGNFADLTNTVIALTQVS